MKFIILCIAILFSSVPSWGQTTVAPLFVTGGLNIKYTTRTNPNVENVSDVYTLDLNVSNSQKFKGTINHRPFISNTFGSNQNAQLAFAMDTFVLNPRNPKEELNIGKLSGVVPITDKNAYVFSQGSLKANTFGRGNARDYESKYSGVALGKPPAAAGFEKLKKEAIQLTKTVKGKTVGISVTKYDKMEFQGLVLGGGPVPVYPEVTVDGVMLYDYVRSAWYMQNIKVTYREKNVIREDIITGNVRWTGSEYQFDVRVNEPAVSEAGMFAGAADESAFFATDDSNPALTGTMKYADVKNGETVVASNVTINLTGNKLEMGQMLYLTKLIFIGAIVPFNAE